MHTNKGKNKHNKQNNNNTLVFFYVSRVFHNVTFLFFLLGNVHIVNHKGKMNFRNFFRIFRVHLPWRKKIKRKWEKKWAGQLLTGLNSLKLCQSESHEYELYGTNVTAKVQGTHIKLYW